MSMTALRAPGYIRTSAPSGFSGMSNIDAASMYPSMTSFSNYDINDERWYISVVHPFQVKHITLDKSIQLGKDWCKAKSFKRRYDAEKYALEQLCQWSDGNWEQDLINKEKLKNFDDDHPEWLI